MFSGGGAKALAHAGAFRALQQAGLEPTHIVATSMGAVIGAALAAGVPFDDVRRRALGLTRRDIAPFNPFAMLAGMFARALIPASALRRTIARLVPVKGFAGLKIPLTVTATDLDSGELVLFPTPETRHSATDLHDALYASCALPLYFPPFELDGRRLADGGLRAVLPLQPAKAIPADLVVAVNVGPGFDEALPPPTAASRPIPPLVRAHGEAMQWLFWQVGGLGPMAGQNGHFAAHAPEKVPYAIERYTKETNRLYGVLDRRLAGRDYIVGDDYSIADMACYPWIVPHRSHGQELQQFPQLARWFARIAARPATLRAYAGVEDAYAPSAQPLSAEARRALFGQAAASATSDSPCR